MKPFKDEHDMRLHVRELKEFYINLLIYAVVCVCALIVWLSMGGGPFWPIWIMFGCGISVALKAIKLEQIPHINTYFPFLSPSWEEEQLERMTIVSSADTDEANERELSAKPPLNEPNG